MLAAALALACLILLVHPACACAAEAVPDDAGGQPVCQAQEPGVLQAQSRRAGARKYVFMGDSYACARGVPNYTPWPELLAKRLKLSSGQCRYVRHSGYGFAREGKRFYQLLWRQRRDPSVTDVLIVGGIGNDRGTKLATVARCYERTVTLLRLKYPNARIIHAIVNWRPEDERYQRAVKRRIPVYRALAEECGVVYLSGCEKVLRGRPDWYQRDKEHPNQKGSKAIAKVLAKKLRKLERAGAR